MYTVISISNRLLLCSRKLWTEIRRSEKCNNNIKAIKFQNYSKDRLIQTKNTQKMFVQIKWLSQFPV